MLGFTSFCLVISITPLFIKQRNQLIEEIHLSLRYEDSTSMYRNLYLECNGVISRENRDSIMHTKQDKY